MTPRRNPGACAKAGILSTGTEILQGLYADTNAQWLSQRLLGAGLEVVRHMAAPDDAASVADALRALARHCDVIIMTGGLGPTEDDLTRQAVSDFLGCTLAEDPRAWSMIEERWALRGRDGTPPPSNRVQCLIPQGARTLYNEWGTAPGFLFEPNGQRPYFAAMPGPPREMKPMFEKYLEPDLAARYGSGSVTRIVSLHTFGVSESELNGRLQALFAETRTDPLRRIGFLAGEARVDVRLIGRGENAADAREVLAPLVRKVRRLVPRGCIYGRDNDTLESVVGKLMRRKNLTLATVESCTGGLVAKRLTDVPGSSEFLLEGWITYSNDAKRKRLGVRADTLEKHGAVSAESAREMARGALEASGADIAVSLTGIAGPSGGTPEKPVGLVHYGLAWRDTKSGSIRVEDDSTCFPSGRELVRLYASHKALDMVRRCAESIEARPTAANGRR